MMIHTDELRQLATERNEAMISLYIPVHGAGSAGHTDEDKVRLKNLICDVDRQITEKSANRRSWNALHKCGQQLLNDSRYWHQANQGLAVLASGDDAWTYRLPISVEPLAVVANRFCIRPLLPVVSDITTFYTLALSQNSVRLFKCTQETIQEITDNRIPKSLSQALGEDWEQKSLQFHTGTPPSGASGTARAAVFHGQGRDDAENKAEIKRFIQYIDNAITQVLDGQTAPLVVAAVEYEAAMYTQLTQYRGIMHQAVLGNPDHLSNDQLHNAALTIVTPYLKDKLHKQYELLAQALGTGQAAVGIAQALPAAVNGHASCIFVRPEQPIWGTFNTHTCSVDVHSKKQIDDEDLLDLALSHAISTGAEVICAQQGDLPEDERIVGLWRF